MQRLKSKQAEWLHHGEDEHFIQCQVAELILQKLIGDTAQECKKQYLEWVIDRAFVSSEEISASTR